MAVSTPLNIPNTIKSIGDPAGAWASLSSNSSCPLTQNNSWEAWNHRVTERMRRNMELGADRYLQAYDYGHPGVTFMATHLGFEFYVGRGLVYVPEFSEILAASDRYIDSLIANHGHPASDVIRMRRIFNTKQGVIGLPYGVEIPPDAAPIEGFLPGKVWFGLIAKNILAVGEPRQLLPALSYPEHELFHNIAMLRFPDLMQTMARVAPRMVKLLGDPDLKEIIEPRLYMVVELTEAIDASKLGELREILKIPASWSASEITVKPVKQLLDGFSNPTIREISAELRLWLELNHDIVGPVFGCPIVPDFHPGLKVKHDRRELLARAAVFLMRLSDIPPARFAEEALTFPLDPRSSVSRLFNESGVFDGQGQTYWRDKFRAAV